MKKQVFNLFAALSVTGSLVAQTSVTGPSSSQSPYIQPLVAGSTVTSIFTAGDAINGYTMAGLPDGIGAFDNNDGTFTLLMNHEFGNTSGATHAYGSTGAFVSKWIINKSNLAVISGADLTQNLNLWNGTGYTTYNAANASTVAALGRHCSGDLAAVSAYFNSANGKGTTARILLNGEETGNEGRVFAHIASGTEAGNSYELPGLGKASWENYVACPYGQDKTIAIGMDDATPGQVYVYIGTKTSSGNEITKAGLTNGKLYGVAVLGLLNESSSVPAANTTFNLLQVTGASTLTGSQINTNSNNIGITNFLRPEDGAWDPSNPRDFYFVTTNSFSSPSRLWRLRFNDIKNPELGGTITALLNGTEGQKMLDNLGINHFGQILLQEDVGNNAHNGKIWQYNIGNNSLQLFAQHDTTRFISGAANYLTQDEESSGMIDAQEILGPGMWLFVDQAHYSQPSPMVEGGQLLAFYNASSANSNPEINVQGNAITIANNNTTTSTNNNTNFGLTNMGQNTVKPFVIQNAGPGALSVTGVNISGVNAGDFTLLSAPVFPFTVPVNGTLTIYIRFSPGVLGNRSAQINIMSNDFDEPTYSYAVAGTGAAPEIALSGNATAIPSGNISYSTTDNTDFGSTFVNVPVTKVFEIQNTGTGSLSVNAITINGNNSAEFTFVNNMSFPMTINAGSTYTFAVQYLPVALGTRTAAIVITNDDTDESNYNYLITAKTLLDVGISQASSKDFAVSIFPNPAKDQATLQIVSEKAVSANVEIVALDGKLIASQPINLNAGSTNTKLSTENLVNGVYVVNIKTTETSTQIKLLINK